MNSDPHTDTHSNEPTVPRAVGIGALAVVMFAAFLALALYVWHDVGPLHFDDRVANRLPDIDRETRDFVYDLSTPGRPTAVVIESLVIAALSWWQTRRIRVMLFCALVPIVVGVTADVVLKPLIDRTSQYGDSLSFPSGHTTGITSVAVVAWLAAVSSWRSLTARVIGAAALAGIVATVGVSRVWTGSHYATDVIGGVLYGVAATLALAALFLRAPARESDAPKGAASHRIS